ncbi:hypothetical protein OCU04_000880 [Sclerotinia nivalis]|uniref:Secreted protein n=1 Tax=Sclerotinia nivalis TaxID=352851 RepID=A0A9X0AX11_9HELO|nr:hypothetical protein OCU04_000880 [Sclerotinia nivalis]
MLAIAHFLAIVSIWELVLPAAGDQSGIHYFVCSLFENHLINSLPLEDRSPVVRICSLIAHQLCWLLKDKNILILHARQQQLPNCNGLFLQQTPDHQWLYLRDHGLL